MLKLLGLYLLSELTLSSVRKCNTTQPTCVYTIDGLVAGDNLVIADSYVDTLKVICHNCQADTSTAAVLKIFSSSDATELYCPRKDTCIGVEVNINKQPDSHNITSNAGPQTVSVELEHETAGKELKIDIIGDNVDLSLASLAKSAWESGSIQCGTVDSTNVECNYICINDETIDSPCKSTSCTPLSRCTCTTTTPANSQPQESTTCPTPEPTEAPSAKPTTASPTLSPTTPQPTTAQPSASPVADTASVDPQTICEDPCGDQASGTCAFDAEKDKRYVCPKKYSKCIANCTATTCEDMILISGADETEVHCLIKDGCKNAKIDAGDEPDLSVCANFNDLTEFEGTKTSLTIKCGDNSDFIEQETSCSDMIVSATGKYTGSVTINVDSKNGYSNGLFNCDIDDDSFASCNLNCGDADNMGCEDSSYDCLANDAQCNLQCENPVNETNACPVIVSLGTSACDGQPSTSCVVPCASGGRYVVPNTVHSVVFDCDAGQDVSIYSAATSTTINASSTESLKDTVIICGVIPSNICPMGFEKSAFSLNGRSRLSLTVNLEGEKSGAATSVLINGPVDANINAKGIQSFEGSSFKCFGPDVDCSLKCKQFGSTCDFSEFVCPNVDLNAINPACKCVDVENPDVNATLAETLALSCPAVTNTETSPPRQSGISNVINKKNINVSKASVFGIVGALLIIVFGCSLFLWCNYKNRFLSEKYFRINSPAQKSIPNTKITSFEVEMK